jgi:putative glutamine amidotransferase
MNMSAKMKRPLIGVVADVRPVDDLPFHMAQDKYLAAIRIGAEGFPVIIPSFGLDDDLADFIGQLDGLLLTGAVSNVAPQLYGAPPEPPRGPYDPDRDSTTLPLIDLALAIELPLLAICRGFQELNVALGGTLSPRLHELPGRIDHRAPYKLPLAEQYAPAHPVRLAPGGTLAGLAEGRDAVMVNSLHWQGIETLASRLSVEATAPDGTIEGVRVTDAKGFTLGVQWHPEWDVAASAFSMALFRRFGDAARKRRAQRG